MAFDANVHHIGLGEVGGTLEGFMLAPGYRKDAQQQSAPTEFGGSSDSLERIPHLSRWTQDDFLGGQYGYIWGEDNKQFTSCRGMIPSQMGKSLRTLPPLVAWETDENYDQSVNPTRLFVSYGGYIMWLAEDRRVRKTLADGTESATDVPVDNRFQVAALDRRVNGFFYVRQSTNTFVRHLYYFNILTDSGQQVQLDIASVGGPPAGPNPNTMIAMESVERGLLVGWGAGDLYRIVYTSALNAATFTKVSDSLPGRDRAMLHYNGLVYILCSDVDSRASIVTYDGTDVLPLTDFPFNFEAYCMEVYGGRIYVGGTGKDTAGEESYAELYEITGSSLRLVRTFAPESRVSGASFPRAIYSMNVHEGLLYLGTEGPNLIAYDVTTDSLYGAIELGQPVETSLAVRYLTSGRDKLVALANGVGSGTDGMYMCAHDAMMLSGDYDAAIETSDFGPEPGEKKRWATFRVVTKYGPVDTIEYSADGGDTYTALATPTVTQMGVIYYSDVDLSGLDTSTHIRFRITFDRGTDVHTFTELISYTLRFLFLGSGKWSWAFTLLAADRMEGVDDSTVTQDVDTMVEMVSNWWKNGTRLNFTDLGGLSYEVTLTDVNQVRPVIGPPLPAGGREANLNVTLVEV